MFSASQRACLRRWLVPSLVDVFFLALFLAVFARPAGVQAMLSDGDTGWHIRNGESVLESGRAPLVDAFSFTRPGDPWCAWEWLSDAIFALAFRWRGLAGVAALAGVTLSVAAAMLFGRLLRRGAGAWIALGVSLAAASASSVHYLARPHVFSILLYTIALGAIERDRRRPGPLIWALVPLAAVWANLHGAFLVLPATLALLALCGEFRRYVPLATATAGATLLNPYGWQLHRHIWEYMNSSWILDHVQEFQSPNIRTEGLLVFAALLLAAAFAAGRADLFEAILVLAWGFAALRSARHIPLFAVAAAPVVASAFAAHWGRIAVRADRWSGLRVFWEVAQDVGRRAHATVWLPASAVALALSISTGGVFSDTHFPVTAVDRNVERLAPASAAPRVLTSDQWADYLIFRLYPRQRVFFDGRSDFYGPRIGGDYRKLQSAGAGWQELLERYGFDLALLPRDWPLSSMLDREPGWHRVYEDRAAVLFARDGREKLI